LLRMSLYIIDDARACTCTRTCTGRDDSMCRDIGFRIDIRKPVTMRCWTMSLSILPGPALGNNVNVKVKVKVGVCAHGGIASQQTSAQSSITTRMEEQQSCNNDGHGASTILVEP